MEKDNPADKIIYSDILFTSPMSPPYAWQTEDPVAIIDTAENFKVQCEIIREGFNVCLYNFQYAKTSEKKWLAEDETPPYGIVPQKMKPLECMEHAYKVRIGSGRLSRIDWISADKIFPVPWQNNMQLKINDNILVRRFGDFSPYKGTILEVPAKQGGQFTVTYEGYSGRNLVAYDDIYKIIKPAVISEIKTGDILYFENMYWVMVIGIQDETHLVVREEGFPARDKIVPIQSLQFLN